MISQKFTQTIPESQTYVFNSGCESNIFQPEGIPMDTPDQTTKPQESGSQATISSLGAAPAAGEHRNKRMENLWKTYGKHMENLWKYDFGSQQTVFTSVCATSPCYSAVPNFSACNYFSLGCSVWNILEPCSGTSSIPVVPPNLEFLYVSRPHILKPPQLKHFSQASRSANARVHPAVLMMALNPNVFLWRPGGAGVETSPLGQRPNPRHRSKRVKHQVIQTPNRTAPCFACSGNFTRSFSTIEMQYQSR